MTTRRQQPVRVLDGRKPENFPAVAHTAAGTPIHFRYEVEIDDKLGLVPKRQFVTAVSKDAAEVKLRNKFKLSDREGALDIVSIFCIGTRLVDA